MADYTLTPTNRSLPSPQGGIDTSLPSNAGKMAFLEEIKEGGMNIARLGATWFNMQREAELVKFRADLQEDQDKALAEMEGKPEDVQRRRWEQHLGKAEELYKGLKNGGARKDGRFLLQGARAIGLRKVEDSIKRRIKDEHDSAIAYLSAQAVETGDVRSLEKLLDTQVKADQLLKDEKKLILLNVGKGIKQKQYKDTQQALSDYARNNPEEVLKWKNASDMRAADPRFKGALNSDFEWIRGEAKGVANEKEDAVFESYSDKILKGDFTVSTTGVEGRSIEEQIANDPRMKSSTKNALLGRVSAAKKGVGNKYSEAQKVVVRRGFYAKMRAYADIADPIEKTKKKEEITQYLIEHAEGMEGETKQWQEMVEKPVEEKNPIVNDALARFTRIRDANIGVVKKKHESDAKAQAKAINEIENTFYLYEHQFRTWYDEYEKKNGKEPLPQEVNDHINVMLNGVVESGGGSGWFMRALKWPFTPSDRWWQEGSLSDIGTGWYPKEDKSVTRIKEGDIVINPKTGERKKKVGSKWVTIP